MRRIFAVIFTMTLALSGVAAATPSFARGGIAHGGGFAHDRLGIGVPVPAAPAMGSPIPAPLAAPAQAPVINGPVSQPAFRGMTGIGE